MKLQKNKKVGNVIFVVEGYKFEFKLLTKIFVDILGFYKEEIKHRPGGKKFKFLAYGDRKNNNKVLILNAKNSNISSVNDDDFLEDVFEFLIENCESYIDIENSRLYYVFDRDYKSNKNENVKDLLSKLKDPFDNDNFYNGGMLIISYPSIESYVISCFYDNTYNLYFELGKDVKAYLKKQKYVVSNINNKKLLHSCEEFFKYIKFNKLEFSFNDYEDVANFSNKVFNIEENYIKNCAKYQVFSMFVFILIDLGIIEC